MRNSSVRAPSHIDGRRRPTGRMRALSTGTTRGNKGPHPAVGHLLPSCGREKGAWGSITRACSGAARSGLRRRRARSRARGGDRPASGRRTDSSTASIRRRPRSWSRGAGAIRGSCSGSPARSRTLLQSHATTRNIRRLLPAPSRVVSDSETCRPFVPIGRGDSVRRTPPRRTRVTFS